MLAVLLRRFNDEDSAAGRGVRDFLWTKKPSATVGRACSSVVDVGLRLRMWWDRNSRRFMDLLYKK